MQLKSSYWAKTANLYGHLKSLKKSLVIRFEFEKLNRKTFFFTKIIMYFIEHLLYLLLPTVRIIILLNICYFNLNCVRFLLITYNFLRTFIILMAIYCFIKHL